MATGGAKYRVMPLSKMKDQRKWHNCVRNLVSLANAGRAARVW
jgi:hypothetical protein